MHLASSLPDGHLTEPSSFWPDPNLTASLLYWGTPAILYMNKGNKTALSCTSKAKFRVECHITQSRQPAEATSCEWLYLIRLNDI